jgi:hypothetical protein
MIRTLGSVSLAGNPTNCSAKHQVIDQLSFDIDHLSFWPLAFGLWPLAFGLWSLAFGLWL